MAGGDLSVPDGRFTTIGKRACYRKLAQTFSADAFYTNQAMVTTVAETEYAQSLHSWTGRLFRLRGLEEGTRCSCMV